VINLSYNDIVKNKIEKVEQFIRRIHSIEITIDDKARQISYMIGNPPKTVSLSDILASKMEMYEKYRNEKLGELAASMCIEWIDKAYYNGVIKEGEALGQKLANCLGEKAEFQKAVEELSERNLELEHEITDLKARVEQMNKVEKIFKEQNK
jgi:hypothetical protein